MSRIALTTLCVILGAAPVAAEPAAAQQPQPEPSPSCAVADVERTSGPPRCVPIKPLGAVLSVVPGLLVPGIGHWLSGERDTARKLSTIGGVSFGIAIAGGVTVAASGASRDVSVPAVTALVAGLSGLALTWFADIYGSTGGARRFGDPIAVTSDYELELGYRFIHEPQFALSHMAAMSARVRLDALEIAPAVRIGLDADHQIARLALGYRFWGARSARPSGDGSFLAGRVGFGLHRIGDEAFAVYTGETAAYGRLDLHRLGDSLYGSFAELELGIATEIIDFTSGGVGFDISSLLLSRLAFGLYFGCSASCTRGELKFFYDHRRDGQLAGSSPGQSNGSGFVGHIGLAGELRRGPLALVGQLAIGSAFAADVGVRYYLGGWR